MRRRWVIMVVAGAAAVWCAPLAVAGAADAGVAPVPAGPVTAAGSWGKAVEVPGSGSLNSGGMAVVSSVSCGSAGNCAAGGYYTDVALNGQVFVVSERNGRWGKAVEVPGSGALNAGGHARLLSVSCGSAASCAAGGYYWDRSRRAHTFVVSEKNGRWGQAIKVPGLGALHAVGGAVLSVSCPSAGDCAAGGQYTDGSGNGQAFVVSDRNGRWGQAIKVPGSGSLNKGGGAAVASVSCASASSCAAGGSYLDRSSHQQAFVVSET